MTEQSSTPPCADAPAPQPTPLPAPRRFVYDPYGGEPRREDLDPAFDIGQYSVTGEAGGDDDNPVPCISFRDIILSMQALNARLPPPTETSVKRWVRRAVRRCANVQSEEMTNAVADAFSDAYLRAAGMDEATLAAQAEAAECAAREDVLDTAGPRKKRPRKGRGKSKRKGKSKGKGKGKRGKPTDPVTPERSSKGEHEEQEETESTSGTEEEDEELVAV